MFLMGVGGWIGIAVAVLILVIVIVVISWFINRKK